MDELEQQQNVYEKALQKILLDNKVFLKDLEKQTRETQRALEASTFGTKEYEEARDKLIELENERAKFDRQSRDNALAYAQQVFEKRLNQEQNLSEKQKILQEQRMSYEQKFKQDMAEAQTDEEIAQIKRIAKVKFDENRKQEEKIQKMKMKNLAISNSAEDKAEARRAKAQEKRQEAEALREERRTRLENGEQMSSNEYNIFERLIRRKESQASWIEWAGNLKEYFGKALSKLQSALNDGVNEAIEDVLSHRTHIMTRLQGFGGESEYDYNSLLDLTKKNLATSPYVLQKDFLAKLDEAVDKGIAYNVEQRTFLATVSDKIATTFDAFDSGLMRIIKLQQADSTASRLGMEASLTKTLNSVFSDTSYLTDEIYKNVRTALIDTESLMTREASTEYEYNVQKWMGSLYSLGFGSDAIAKIAQGLNYLGTGDVTALANDSSLQTLLAMSASRSGQDYAQMLVEGIDASGVNKLLKAMVEYLKEIATDTRSNNVVKSAYGNLLNMSMSDIRAISSLTESDISSIYSQNLTYEGANAELQNQLSSIKNRLSIGEMAKNVVDNFVYTLGEGITESAVSYVTWEITNLIEKATGGINLPAIHVLGNSVDLSAFTIEGIVKSGLVGLSTLSQIGSIIGSISKENNGGLNLSTWGGTDILERGKDFTVSSGFENTTSYSSYVGSGSAEDIKNASIAGKTEEAHDIEQITNSGMESEHTFDDFYENVFINEVPMSVKEVGDYTTSDVYRSLFVSKTPVVVSLDPESGLGAMLTMLASNITNANRIVNVNLKSSDIVLKTSLDSVESVTRESFRTFMKGAFAVALAEEMKKTVIGGEASDSDTIQKVCTKILNDSVDTMVKNTYFDDALTRYVTYGI